MSAVPKEALAYNPRLSRGTELRDMFAGLAMQAHLQAAWNYPAPSRDSYEKWKNEQAPDADTRFDAWVSYRAYAEADAMLARREATT